MKKYLPRAEMELLPYHKFGFGKYEALGMDLPDAAFGTPTKEKMEYLKGILREIDISLGGLQINKRKDILSQVGSTFLTGCLFLSVFALYMIVFVFLDEAEACCPRTGVGGDGRANLEGRQEFHAGNRFLQQGIKAVHIVPDGICAGHCDIMCGIFAGFLECFAVMDAICVSPFFLARQIPPALISPPFKMMMGLIFRSPAEIVATLPMRPPISR